MSAVSLRAMERADIDGILDLWQLLNHNGHIHDPRYKIAPDGRAAMRVHMLDQWFGRFLPFPVGFVAIDDGVLVGFVAGSVVPSSSIVDRPATAMIGDMWVSASHRRQGLGRGLVQRFSNAATDAGFPWIQVGTLAKDKQAVAFWKAMGFDDWMVSLLKTSE